jgi:hypothetical protein
VVTAGAGPFGWQWQFNGTHLEGETAPILALDEVTAGQAGSYRVLITNLLGATVSQAANLIITASDTAPALLANAKPASTNFSFSLLGDVGRRYRIQSSTNLLNWNPEKNFPTPFSPTFDTGRIIWDAPLDLLDFRRVCSERSSLHSPLWDLHFDGA